MKDFAQKRKKEENFLPRRSGKRARVLCPHKRKRTGSEGGFITNFWMN